MSATLRNEAVTVTLAARRWWRWLRRRVGDGGERGVVLVEYALLLTIIAVAMIPPLTYLAHSIDGYLDRQSERIDKQSQLLDLQIELLDERIAALQALLAAPPPAAARRRP